MLQVRNNPYICSVFNKLPMKNKTDKAIAAYGKKLRNLDKEKELTDKKYCRLFWKKIEPLTKTRNGCIEAIYILNKYELTVGLMELKERVLRRRKLCYIALGSLATKRK